MSLRFRCLLTLLTLVACCSLAEAQPPGGGFGPGDGGGRPPGPMGGEEIELVDEFDADHNGWLDEDERAAARKALAERPRGGRRGGRRGGFGPPGGGPPGGGPPGGGPRGGGRRGPPGGDLAPPKPGPRVEKSEAATFPGADLYDPNVVRTLFLDFDTDDWEAELQDFKGTDVEVPAKLTVDGVEYPGVGVHFRGMSSFMMIPAGSKRSLNVSLNFIDKDQRLEGYKTLNLLNGNGDPSMMSTVLYSEIARERTPAPRANFVRVVINGESWGVYTNVQQFDKVFAKENYGSSKGTRWKVPGSPGADGGLRYLGEELEPYKQRYEMKSDDGDEEWRSLVELSRVLNETPLEQLEEKLAPILDIDDTLWFLALDVSLVNSDGYWTRASDYYLFRDSEGVFHPVPHDMNEAFRGGGPPGRGGPGGARRGGPGGRRGFGPPDRRDGPPGGGFGGFFGPPPMADRPDRDAGRPDQRSGRGERRGFGPPGGGPPGGQRGGPPGGIHGGVDLDPLVGLDNERTPLRGRLLAIPHLRERYLGYVRQIAAESLDWDHLGPRVAHYRQLIREAVEQDTRKLSTTEAFDELTSPATPPKASAENEPGRSTSLRQFSEARSAYLLKGESD